MRRMLSVFVLLGVAGVAPLQAAPISYMGRLAGLGGSGDGDLFITSSAGPGMGWNSPTSSLSWQVDNTTTRGKWHYQYTISVPKASARWEDIERVLVEASNGTRGPMFTSADLSSPASNPADWLYTVDVGTHGPTGNPNLPRNVYGIMFSTGFADPTTPDDQFRLDSRPGMGRCLRQELRGRRPIQLPVQLGIDADTGVRSSGSRPVTGVSWTTFWSRIPWRLPWPLPPELSCLARSALLWQDGFGADAGCKSNWMESRAKGRRDVAAFFICGPALPPDQDRGSFWTTRCTSSLMSWRRRANWASFFSLNVVSD